MAVAFLAIKSFSIDYTFEQFKYINYDLDIQLRKTSLTFTHNHYKVPAVVLKGFKIIYPNSLKLVNVCVCMRVEIGKAHTHF